MIRLYGDYWRSSEAIVNFGDYITELILPAFGYRFQRTSTPECANHGECLYAVGSLLDAAWFQRCSDVRIVVWGCGYWGDPRFTKDHLNRARLAAVRGPRTAAELGLDALPIGDPALLLPYALPDRRINRGKTVHVCHFHNKLAMDVNCDVRATAAVHRDRWNELLETIIQAEFLLTNAMHAAIVAQAYGVPWALSLTSGQRHDKPAKWADWAAYLGITLEPCSTVREGWNWWERTGRNGRVRDLGPLVEAFPYPNHGLAALV